MKYAPRKVYIKESGGYVELSYTDFCRRRNADQTYMDKLFIPVQGCLLEVVREQYTDFYRDKERWRYLQKLEKKAGRIYDTVAQAMSGIVYAAENKQIDVSIVCPENLTVAHDSKWTAEHLLLWGL